MRLLTTPALIIILAGSIAAGDDYPGGRPDCWLETRIVHGDYVDQDRLTDSLTIAKVTSTSPMGDLVYSPNKGHWFAKEGFRPDVGS